MDCPDAFIPNLQTLRTNTTVSDAVNGLLASYDGRAHQELCQGKQRVLVYLIHDTICTHPHMR